MGLNCAVQVSTRYSLTIFNTDVGRSQINMTASIFGSLTSISLLVYAFAMLLNGILIDKYGGRLVYFVGMVIHTAVNLSFGLYCHIMWQYNPELPSSSLPFVAFFYSATNYLQTLGPLVPVKVTANWYRKEERGGISGLFGICRASGYLLAFAGNGAIYAYCPPSMVFIIPGVLLFILTILSYYYIYNSPEDYGIPTEDNLILREVEITTNSSQQTELFYPPSMSFKNVLLAIPSSLWLNALGMMICGGIREGFFNYIANYLDSKFGDPPGSILQSVAAASYTFGAASSAFFVAFINSYTDDNAALGGVLYFLILTFSMLAFTLSTKPIEVVIFGGFGSFAIFAIAGLRRKLSMDYGGVKRAAFVTGFLGCSQFIGGGIFCFICSILINDYGYYITFFASIFI